MTVLVPLICIVLGFLLWPVFTAEPQPTVRPLTMDEEAAQGRFWKDAENEAKRRGNVREATRRHYEGITWPAMQWEIRKREILRYVSAHPAERTLEPNRHRASA